MQIVRAIRIINKMMNIYIIIATLINFASISYDGANVGFGDLINSNFNLLNWAKELYILNITEIEKKYDHFILKGNMHKEFNETSEFEINNDDMNANLIYQKKGEYKLVPNSSIKNKTIENRIAESSKSKIFIIASSLDNKLQMQQLFLLEIINLQNLQKMPKEKFI